MTVKILSTGKEMTVNSSYGARLVEQGRAVTVHKPDTQKVKRGKGSNGTDG